jgi:hypothetical protein
MLKAGQVLRIPTANRFTNACGVAALIHRGKRRPRELALSNLLILD